MRALQHVPIPAIDPGRFALVISPAEYRALLSLIERGAAALRGRVIWNVNSTASGGGVAELLRTLLGYSRGAGVDARWLVISGDRGFFEITKRLHNQLHGFGGGARGLTDSDRAIYEGTLAENASELLPLLHPRDIVILHDPQTAGLIRTLRRTGALVIWRCHVGVDRPNQPVRDGWTFLRGYLQGADACVFSRRAFVWEGLDQRRIAVIHPSIDPFSAKNQDQTPAESTAILARSGIVLARQTGAATFTRSDGSPGRVDRRAEMVQTRPLTAAERVIVQVSRWDRLKDPGGVMSGFARHVAPLTDAHLVLAGPAAGSVADDPEATAVLGELTDEWRQLPQAVRDRVHLASLPVADIEENAATVNALQRCADVVVQKSVAEGFGLTVAEAMWKERAVVASAIGGIQDQIVNGESGVLLPDPTDLAAYGAAVVALLDDHARARRLGVGARERIREHFLGPDHLERHFELIQRVIATREPARPEHAAQVG